MRRLVVLLAVMGMGLLPGIASAGSHTYQSGPIAVPIPDLSTVFHDIVVPDRGHISDLNVSVTLNHTFVYDLIVMVTHVDTGTQVILANHDCGSEDNMSARSSTIRPRLRWEPSVPSLAPSGRIPR